jgi:2,4-dienoyl-CoA reductase-like NADH-dependent reductase (Old Yellow Enzyme family)
MSIPVDPLFRPFSANTLNLPNRIVMAPMTRSFSPDGVPGADVAAYYRRRAENQVGLIITEGTVIDHPASTNDPRVPRFCGAAALAGWANVLAEVHAVGGKIMPQIWHIGTVRRAGDRPNPEAPPIGPSGLYKPGTKVVEPMSEAEIAAVIDAYARAAADARRLGFDGVELHGAHGYLIDQFFWEGTNQRSDRYGGDMVKRTRFAVEVIQACRRAVGPDFPILLRYSQWKQQDYAARLAATPELLEKFLAPLADAGVDVFHCSTRRFWEPEFEGSALNLAGWTKKLTGKPVITVGSVSLDNDMVAAFRGKAAAITSIDKLIEMFARDEVDLVAVGRALLVDPAWAVKVREDRMQDLLPFTPESLRSLS